MSMDHPGYESLASVLQAAYDQAATGKGAERHANDLPFHEQPMQQIARRRGIGFLLGQADKKTEEAQGMLERGERDAWRREILGAINYLAGALVFTADPDYGADPAYFAGSSSTVEASVSDGPTWYGAGEPPQRGRFVEIVTAADHHWSCEWKLGFVVSQGSRWRYIDA